MTRKSEAEPLTPGQFRLIGRIFALVGALLLSIGGWLLSDVYRFSASAHATKAVVVSVKRHRTSSDSGLRYTFFPTFRYTDAAGAERVAQVRIGSDGYNYPVGSEVPILFDPEDPEDVRVAEGSDIWMMGVIATILGVAFVGLGVVMTRSARAALRMEER